MNRILVVDDCCQICELLETVLIRRGYNVTTANGGIEGMLRFDEQEFDLVISDICMPDIDGNALAEHIKSTTIPVPVIALTGNAELAGKAFDRILMKPLHTNGLLNIIEELSVVAGMHKIASEKTQSVPVERT